MKEKCTKKIGIKNKKQIKKKKKILPMETSKRGKSLKRMINLKNSKSQLIKIVLLKNLT